MKINNWGIFTKYLLLKVRGIYSSSSAILPPQSDLEVKYSASLKKWIITFNPNPLLINRRKPVQTPLIIRFLCSLKQKILFYDKRKILQYQNLYHQLFFLPPGISKIDHIPLLKFICFFELPPAKWRWLWIKRKLKIKPPPTL